MTEFEEDGQAPARRWAGLGRKDVVQGMLVVLVSVLAIYTFYQEFSVLETLENAAQDFQARIRSPDDAVRQQLAIVRISDRDYEELFDASSPLAAEPLRALLAAVARGRPRTIAVDLATDHLQGDGFVDRFLPGPDTPPIIWGRELVPCADVGPAIDCSASDRVLLPYAGSGVAGSLYGVVRADADRDGVIRRYSRAYQVGDSLAPTLAHALASTDDEALVSEDDEDMTRERLIKYRPVVSDGVVFDASTVMQTVTNPGFGETGFLRDKLVIVGGMYRAARDEYPTPLLDTCAPREQLEQSEGGSALAPGVCILAQITLTELEGGGVRPVHSTWVWLVLVVCGVAMLVLFLRVEFSVAFWVALGMVVVVPLLMSLLFTRTLFGLWAHTTPLLIAILIHQLHAHAMGYRNEQIKKMRIGRGEAAG